MVKFLRNKLFLPVIFLFTLGSAFGATCNTTKNGNWTDPTVWSCGRAPLSSDVVVINHDVTLNTNYTALSGLTINSGGSLKEDGTARTLQVGQNTGGSYPGFINNDTIIVSFMYLIKSSSTINSTGYVKVKQDFRSQNDGDLTINGKMIVDGDWYLSNGNVQTAGGGTLQINGCLDTSGGGQLSNITVSWCVTDNTCSNYATIQSAMSCNVVLPVQMVSFKAFCGGGSNVNLVWSTSGEKDNDHFVIERSGDKMNFIALGIVKGSGTVSTAVTYSFMDQSASGEVNYYRLKQVDMNGGISYSSIIISNCNQEEGMFIFPNPAEGNDFYVNFSKHEDGEEVLLVVTNILGQEMYDKMIVLEHNQNAVYGRDLQTDFTPGIYHIIASSHSFYANKKLVVH